MKPCLKEKKTEKEIKKEKAARQTGTGHLQGPTEHPDLPLEFFFF